MVQFKRLFKGILFFVLSFFVKQLVFSKRNPGKVLILKPDGLGDFFIQFPYIQAYINYFPDQKTFLLVQEFIKPLAATHTSLSKDSIIGYGMKTFEKNLTYALKVMVSIKREGFETVIYPVFSRSPSMDALVFASGAKEKIGFVGDICNSTMLWQKISSTFYTQKSKLPYSIYFEPERMSYFWKQNYGFQNVMDQFSQMNFDDSESAYSISKKSVMLFIGATDNRRKWPIANFRSLCAMLVEKEMVDQIVILGGKEEIEEATSILEDRKIQSISLNLCGKLPLEKLPNIVLNGGIMVANESAGYHLAALLHKPFVCISNGQHYGRYHPYPLRFSHSIMCYPNPTLEKAAIQPDLVEQYALGSTYTAADVPIEKVFNALVELTASKN